MTERSGFDRLSTKYDQDLEASLNRVDLSVIKELLNVFVTDVLNNCEKTGIGFDKAISMEDLFEFLWDKWIKQIKCFSLYFECDVIELGNSLAAEFENPIIEYFMDRNPGMYIQGVEDKIFGSITTLTKNLAKIFMDHLLKEWYVDKIVKVGVVEPDVNADLLKGLAMVHAACAALFE